MPLSGRTETRLRPGRWYLGVRAGNASNVRYRLLASTGNVREMAIDPSSATAQIPSDVTSQVLPDKFMVTLFNGNNKVLEKEGN